MIIWLTLVKIAAFASTPLLAFSYIPQIVQLYKTKNTEGININFWYILDAALLCFVILSLESFIQTGSVVLLLAQLINLALALVITIQVLMYRK